MGLRARMLTMPFDERISYDPTLKMLFLDFSQLAIISERDVQRIKTEVESHVKSLQRPVHAIVNYSGCSIESAALESYGRMVD
jgi:propionate CoA-transferase